MLLNSRGKLLDVSQPKVMGILNLTTDSFFDGGRYLQPEQALERASRLVEEGVDIIDIGAYSSRPGADEVSEKTELERILPVLQKIRKAYPEGLISIDTFRASVAKACLLEGAHIINDVSGGSLDSELWSVVAEFNVPYVLMHSRGTPKTMQGMTSYQQIMADMVLYFSERVHQLRAIGVKDIILDAGFGFAKTLEQNYEILRRFEEFQLFGLPLLGALSRKSMIYKLLNIEAAEALNGTSVLHSILLQKGANLLRVHDVKEAKQVIALLKQVNNT